MDEVKANNHELHSKCQQDEKKLQINIIALKSEDLQRWNQIHLRSEKSIISGVNVLMMQIISETDNQLA